MASAIGSSPTKTADDKLALFQELIEAAEATPNHPAERFVLIWKACELAREAGDADLMLQAIEALASEFEIDAVRISEQELLHFAERAKTYEEIQSLMHAANRAIARAMADENYASADVLAGAVAHVSARPQGKEFRSDAAAVRDAVKAIGALRQELKAARQVLQATAADPAANLTLGRYECFVHDDWEAGLAYLAKGDDAGLRQMAGMELDAPPESQAAQLRLADAWWDLGKTRQGR